MQVRDVAAIVGLISLVHGGLAWSAHVDEPKPTAAKRWTEVEIRLIRPPPKPVLPPEPVESVPPATATPSPPRAAPPRPAAVIENRAVPVPAAEGLRAEEPAIAEPAAEDSASSLPTEPEAALHADRTVLDTATEPPPAAPPSPPVIATAPPPPTPVIEARADADDPKTPRSRARSALCARVGKARRAGCR